MVGRTVTERVEWKFRTVDRVIVAPDGDGSCPQPRRTKSRKGEQERPATPIRDDKPGQEEQEPVVDRLAGGARARRHSWQER